MNGAIYAADCKIPVILEKAEAVNREL